MFNHFVPERIEFRSNPPLPEKVVVVPGKDKHGNFCNEVKVVPSDNKSIFDGVRFDRDTMSLRAMLNLGVPLREVSMPSLANDPSEAQNAMLAVERQIMQRIDEIEAPSTDPSSIEPVEPIQTT